MQQANFEMGFEDEDIPLMIEAIPMNSESIVLIITKVEDPEELDTRFSRFAPDLADEDDDEDYDEDYEEAEGSDEILDLFRRIQGRAAGGAAETLQASEKETVNPAASDRLCLFSFDSLGQLIDVARVTAPHYDGQSAVYKDDKNGQYLLALEQGQSAPEKFDRVCNVISEYGALKRASITSIPYLEEHCEILIPENALSRLGNPN